MDMRISTVQKDLPKRAIDESTTIGELLEIPLAAIIEVNALHKQSLLLQHLAE